MKKIFQKKKAVYTFHRYQILGGDVREFFRIYDPFRLSDSQLREYHGNLIIAFEGVDDCAVATHQELRVLLRRLHAIWPWSSYFLDLERPLGPTSPLNDRPLLAVGLCVADLTTCYWRKADRLDISYGPELQKFRNTCHVISNRLGNRAGFSTKELAARHLAIHEQFKDVLQ